MHALSGKTNAEQGWQGGASLVWAARLTVNRPLWGMQLFYHLPLSLNSGSLCPSLSLVLSPVVIVNAKSLSLCSFPHAAEKNINSRRHFRKLFLAKVFAFARPS